MRFSCKIILNKKPGVKGKCLIYLQSFINGDRSKRSLGMSIEEKFFLKGAGLISEAHPEANDLNITLRNKISRANKIAARYRILEEMNGIQLSKALFEKEFFTDGNSKGNFLKWYKERMDYRYEKKIVEYNTFRNERCTYNKLKAYKEKVSFADLTSDFMKSINLWMINKGNGINTRWNVFKHLHAYLKEATKEGIYLGDPFEGLDVRAVEGPITYIEQKELASLQKYYNGKKIPANQKEVLKQFLFACFTGLRISDMKKISYTNLVAGYLVFIAHKNKKRGKFVRVPLSKNAKAFIRKEKLGDDKIFDTNRDPVTNRILKDIAKACTIKKRITFHVARHSFATLYLELGGQVQVLQQYLGHSKITTTMRYVHVSDKVKASEIKRFDKL